MNDTTESERTLVRVPRSFPVLRLLYCGDQIVPHAPSFALRPGPMRIGRTVDPRLGITLLQSRRASREHAVIEVRSGARGSDGTYDVRIADLKTKNGTYVNGWRVESAPLQDGDVLRLGDALLLVRHELADGADAAIATLAGVSRPMRTLRQAIARVAVAPAPVLLCGESGTGKELAARALHQLSGRRGRFVAVNCSAIPDALAESQLFGHTVGSFTNATAEHEGFFRAAQGGTLLLDEVGELTPAVQPKLLRVLEEDAVTAVGSTRARKAEARIVAASNRDLRLAVAQGRFRADLYARLCAIVIELPPLAARREDILLLLQTQLGGAHPPLTVALAEALLLYDWPLNVRELFQVAAHLKYAVGDPAELDLALLANRLPRREPALTAANRAPPRSDRDDKTPPRQPLPREEVAALLREHHGIVSRVARAVGRSPRQIHRWIDQYGIAIAPRPRKS